MKARYDPDTDTLYLGFADAAVAETEEVHPGVMFDFDAQGRIVAVEVLDASQQFPAGSELKDFPSPSGQRKRVDATLLRSLTSTMPPQPEDAATFVRSMRDDDRY